MLCPQCQQGAQDLAGDACPHCGFPCAEFTRRVRHVQVVLTAIFACTLVFAAIVAFLELYTDYRPAASARHTQLMAWMLVGVVVVEFVVALFLERRYLQQHTLDAYARAITVLGALAQAPAIFGLLLYLLSGSIQWMVIFLAISWAEFLWLGSRLPRILRGITDCLRT